MADTIYFASKTLLVAFRPVILALTALGFALWWTRKKRGLDFWLVASAFGLLFVLSLPILSRELIGNLEAAYPSLPIAEYPTADLIVVLGGSTNSAVKPRFEPEELGFEGRLLSAARLYRAGKAKRILVVGGDTYLGPKGEPRTAAGDMREVLLDMGVPDSAITSLPGSRNTREDAQATLKEATRAKAHSLLMVTDAWHSRRAMQFFLNVPFTVTAVPVARHIVGEGWSGWDFIPETGCLDLAALALKEHLGFWAAKILH